MLNNQSWPHAQVFVVRNRHLLFCPIAKNACTSLKRAMVSLSDSPQKKNILAGDVHQETDQHNTGLQLKDYSPAEANRIASDPKYFKFAVLRDPCQRVASAFVEKLVLHRRRERNWAHTDQIYDWAAKKYDCVQDEIIDRITFRDFVDFLGSRPAEMLDAHWKPQELYLRGINYDALYEIGKLKRLEDDIEAQAGVSVTLEHVNKSSVPQGKVLDDAADRCALDLATNWPVRSESLLKDSSLIKELHEIFNSDYALLESIRT